MRMSSLVFVLLMSVATIKAETYTGKGPYSFDVHEWTQTVTSNGASYGLDIRVTHPANAGNTPCPIVFFYHGFSMRSGYFRYAEKLATWGYVIVQYNIRLRLSLTNDETEVSFFPEIWNSVQNQMPRMPTVVNVDYSAVAVGGHSRGGKLAALIAAKNPDVKGVFLIDPVDGDGRRSPGEGYPSAVEALQGRNIRMVVAGSNISGSCNPADYDFHHFWRVAGEGSWKTVIINAGHAQFVMAGGLQLAWNLLCGSGRQGSETVIDTTTPFLVAWLERTFRLLQTNLDKMDETNSLHDFFVWADSEQNSGRLDFVFKDSQVVEDLTPVSEDRVSVEL